MWVEQEGHFINLEGRLQAAHRGLTPPADVRSHVDIIESIAAQLNFSLGEDWKSEMGRRVSINPVIA
jgi:formate dehydrogenase major subunit